MIPRFAREWGPTLGFIALCGVAWLATRLLERPEVNALILISLFLPNYLLAELGTRHAVESRGRLLLRVAVLAAVYVLALVRAGSRWDLLLFCSLFAIIVTQAGDLVQWVRRRLNG